MTALSWTELSKPLVSGVSVIGAPAAASLRQRAGARIDLHSRGHACCERHVLRHLIDVDAHRDALRQTHPGEDRVDVGKPFSIGLCGRNIDAAGEAVDVTADNLSIAHQLDLGGIADPDRFKIRLLEIAVDPERISVDDGNLILPNIGVIA
jgi:hypothetical protein